MEMKSRQHTSSWHGFRGNENRMVWIPHVYPGSWLALIDGYTSLNGSVENLKTLGILIYCIREKVTMGNRVKDL